MRRLVVILIVVAALAVAVDRLTCKLAEGQVASRIQSSADLAARPGVSIHGFPFLTQVFGGLYTRVDADLEDLSIDQGARVDQVKLRLSGVHVPFSGLVKGNLSAVPVNAATATGIVSYASMDAAAKAKLPGDALGVQFARGKGGSDRVAVTGTYAAGSQQLQFTGNAMLSAQDGQLVVSIPPDALDVPQAVRARVAASLGTSYRLPVLPLGLKVSSVSVGDTGVAVTAQGAHLVLTRVT